MSKFDPCDLEKGHGKLCPFFWCIWSRATTMDNLNGIHAIIELKKCGNLGQHLTPMTLKIGQYQPTPLEEG